MKIPGFDLGEAEEVIKAEIVEANAHLQGILPFRAPIVSALSVFQLRAIAEYEPLTSWTIEGF
jgi:hypothetical protein